MILPIGPRKSSPLSQLGFENPVFSTSSPKKCSMTSPATAVAPKQYISYQREAFFGKYDSDFRLTFDRKITERRYDLGLDYESYGNYIIGADQRLMEVKVSNAIPDWLVAKLSELEIYKTSFSKYGRAYQNFVRSQVESAGRASGSKRIYISGISMVNNSIMNRSV